MYCGVCGETFDDIGAKEELLDHCVNAHTKESANCKTTANSICPTDGYGTTIENICASTIPYTFPPQEIKNRFVREKKNSNTYGRKFGKRRKRPLSEAEKIKDNKETQELLKNIDAEFDELLKGGRKKSRRRKSRRRKYRRRKKTKRRKKY